MYPYGPDQHDEEMDVQMIDEGLCKEIVFEYGLWFFDDKRYELFVSTIEVAK